MYVGGVDHNDKMYRLDTARKSYKWYTRIDRKCAMWAVYNSYVLYKEKNPNQDYREYQLNLIHTLVNNREIRTAKRKVDTPQQSVSTHTDTHTPIAHRSHTDRTPIAHRSHTESRQRSQR